MIYYFPLLSIYVSFSYRFLCWIDSNTCRLGFYGKLIEIIDGNDPTQLQRIKIFKIKQKEGLIDRVCSITQLSPSSSSSSSSSLFDYIYQLLSPINLSSFLQGDGWLHRYREELVQKGNWYESVRGIEGYSHHWYVAFYTTSINDML